MRPIWLAVTLVLMAGCFSQPLVFVVSFGNAHGLEAGSPIVYNGVTIGKVEEVALDPSGNVAFHVRVDPKYRDQVLEGSRFKLEGEAANADSPAARLTMTRGSGATLSSNAIVKGDEPNSWTQRGAESGRKLMDYLATVKNSKEAQWLGKKVHQVGDSILAKGKRIDASDIDAVKRRAEDLAKRLEQAGKSEQAQEVRRRLAPEQARFHS
jgi:hypothetical protein